MKESKAIWAITRKDMKAVTSNIQVWLPMLVVPLILGVILPVAAVWGIRMFGLERAGNIGFLLQTLNDLPEGALRDRMTSLHTVDQKVIWFGANYMFASLFLLIPVMASSVIAANSFVGEKERKTMESLLYTPISTTSIFIGKLLSALIPSLLISFVTALLYGIFINLSAYPLFGELIFPTWNWVLLLLWVIPPLSLAIIFLNVFISAKVDTFQAAYQIGGAAVLPFLALITSQVTGVLILSPLVLFVLGAVLILLDIFLIRMSTHWSSREKLAGTHLYS